MDKDLAAETLSRVKESIREDIIEETEENLDEFISKRCVVRPKAWCFVSEFKSEYIKAYGWISQKVLCHALRCRGIRDSKLYYDGKQQRVWLGIKIAIKPE